jgi:hypothetical protein
MRTIIAFLLLVPGPIFAQSLESQLANDGTLLRLQLSTAPFPHPARGSGHQYGGKTFPADTHYRDSTVLVFIPRGFRSDRPLDLAVHIHGWWNNVDSVLVQFRLAEQLTASRKNAALVIPQGPKGAPDSHGGRLEDEGGFRRFIEDVGRELHARRLVSTPTVRHVVLSGHSGAYRMISSILLRGGANERITEVYLFDALYGQLEKYGHWLTQEQDRFVAVYCDSGGTKATTESLMEDLAAWKIPFAAWEESDPTLDLSLQRINFIHSDLGHNEVLMVREQYRRSLESGTLENK